MFVFVLSDISGVFFDSFVVHARTLPFELGMGMNTDTWCCKVAMVCIDTYKEHLEKKTDVEFIV